MIFVICLLFLICLSFVVFFCVRRKRRETPPAKSISSFSGSVTKSPTVELKTPVSTVKLLGGFQVFDKEGVDITDNFTPIVKQILLYLLLSTVKDGKKVTSEKLDETFWFEMDKASASNNRSVNVRKLRLLLEKVFIITDILLVCRDGG